MLRDAIKAALKSAMAEKDDTAKSTVRLIMAALKDRDIDARGKGNAEGISDDDILGMLQSMIKQRRDSIDMYEKGGRCELAEQEAAEIQVIQRFLPRQIEGTELEGAVDGAIQAVGAESIKDMGKVMAHLRGQFAGQMDFGRASDVVKGRLAG